MAITVTQRASIHSTTDSTSYTASPAWTPAANTLLIAWVVPRNTTAQPTGVSGHGVTYSQKATIDITTVGVLMLYVADSGATPTSAAVTATWSANRTGCHIMEQEVDGEDLSGGALAAIVQAPTNSGSGTEGTVTLAAAGNAANRPISCFTHPVNELSTPRTNWAELDDGSFATPVNGAESQWRSDAFETTASASWATSGVWRGIAAEIKAEVAVSVKHQATLLGVGG